MIVNFFTSISQVYHKISDLYIGESGLVYKAYVKKGGQTDIVAIKTGKGEKKIEKDTQKNFFTRKELMSNTIVCVFVHNTLQQYSQRLTPGH